MNTRLKFLTYIVGTASIFGFMFLLQKVAVNFEFLNVFEQVLSDFRFSDLYFNKIRDKDEILFEENIVIVNIGDLNREGIAAQIEILNQHKPKAIGLDALLFTQKENHIDSTFEAVVARTQNIVLGSELHHGRTEKGKVVFDSLAVPLKRFLPHVETAFVNLITEEEGATNNDFATVRLFSPLEQLSNGKKELSFSVKLAQKIAPKKVEKFLLRNKHQAEEHIYYKGNWDKYTILDVGDVFGEKFEPSMIKDKIVLMGYLGDNYKAFTWSGDRFYTPLNPNQVGRSNPDMYGVVVHANIISMILEEHYFDTLADYWQFVFAVVICFLNVVIFTNVYYSRKLGIWYDILTKGVQLVEVIVLIYLFILALGQYHLILNLTLTIFAILISGDVLEVFLAFWSNLFFIRKGGRKHF